MIKSSLFLIIDIFFNFLLILSKFLLLDLLLLLLSLPLRLIEFDKFFLSFTSPIVKELESGEVNLDDAINKFTEAMKIAKECSVKLDSATKAVNKILKENGELEEFKGLEEE